MTGRIKLMLGLVLAAFAVSHVAAAYAIESRTDHPAAPPAVYAMLLDAD
jgi:hypothetical protein